MLHEMLMELVLTCPHLRELDHCDIYDKHEAFKRIAFKREGEEGQKVSYTVTKPPPRYAFFMTNIIHNTFQLSYRRDAFDITDGTFD